MAKIPCFSLLFMVTSRDRIAPNCTIRHPVWPIVALQRRVRFSARLAGFCRIRCHQRRARRAERASFSAFVSNPDFRVPRLRQIGEWALTGAVRQRKRGHPRGPESRPGLPRRSWPSTFWSRCGPDLPRCPERNQHWIDFLRSTTPQSLFEGFSATMGLSDFPHPFVAVVLLADSHSADPDATQGQMRDLPAPVYVSSVRARGLRPRRGGTALAMTTCSVLPSVPYDAVGPPNSIFLSRLNTQPTRCPVNASPLPSRAATHDSGPTWFATPWLGGTCTRETYRFVPAHREIKILMRLLSKNTNELKTGAPGRFGSETSEAWLANGRCFRNQVLVATA